ncbi:hypothetical protein N7451_012512 [Penicillium sp. IBT 35674x]|nr:hypothetical protein N7451_012512 [Penicillium sp. IBT 35674x]
MSLTSVSVPLTILTHFMQWSSAVIVMGTTSYFMHSWPKGEHTIYEEVTVTFVSPFMPSRFMRFVTPIDIIFSYLWLTAFIFAAQGYNWKDCAAKAPVGARCALKKANESFMFLAFLFTIFAIFLELPEFWSYRKEIDVDEERKHINAQHARDGPTNTVA